MADDRWSPLPFPGTFRSVGARIARPGIVPRPSPFIQNRVRNRIGKYQSAFDKNQRTTARFYSLFSAGKRRHSVRRRCKTSRTLPFPGTDIPARFRSCGTVCITNRRTLPVLQTRTTIYIMARPAPYHNYSLFILHYSLFISYQKSASRCSFPAGSGNGWPRRSAGSRRIRYRPTDGLGAPQSAPDGQGL